MKVFCLVAAYLCSMGPSHLHETVVEGKTTSNLLDGYYWVKFKEKSVSKLHCLNNSEYFKVPKYKCTKVKENQNEK